MRVFGPLALAGLLVAGCGDDGGQPVGVREATVQADGTTLDLGLTICSAEQIQVTTEETDDEVRVTVEATGVSDEDCAGSTQVELTRRLGRRTLIDTESGEEVEVTRAG